MNTSLGSGGAVPPRSCPLREYHDYLHEAFEAFGPVTLRRMFGGYGVFHDGLMFALVADDTLYLKADADSADAFLRAGLEPFRYQRRGRQVALSYYRAPDELLEDRELAADWARRAFAAASRSRRGSRADA